jgi:XTP/dITP diphosphohydrolase
MSHPPITRLVIATHNAGKLAEFRTLFAGRGLDLVSAGELGLPEPEETGTTFIANAILKAEAAARSANLPALADDSGLCVDALGGDPGIYSARWAGKPADFGAAMIRIGTLLDEKGASTREARRAHFVAALALVWPDGTREVVEGKVFGTLVAPRGALGFGYDPMFVPDGHDRSFGEMGADEKHGIPADGSEALSHRARAFQMLERRLFEAAPSVP